MIKVSRQNLSESYNITADWLSDYVRDMQRNSNLNNIKHLVVGATTIEQKMSDIKRRVGFENIRIKAEEENQKIAQQKEEGEESSNKFSEQDVHRMKNILQYITDMIEHEKNLDISVILGRCREEDGLHFHDLKIDLDKLKEFIEEKLGNKSKHEKHEVVNYIPFEAPSTDEMSIDTDADYFSHAHNTAL